MPDRRHEDLLAHEHLLGLEPTLSSPMRPPASESVATAKAPTYRPPADTARASRPLVFPSVGQRIDDFEIVRILGEGSFGKVYLARQVSLDRHVALKVTANRGSEARTLASLEHDYIVQVFSESVDAERDMRLMC